MMKSFLTMNQVFYQLNLPVDSVFNKEGML